jgi:hypothetical protein
MFMMYFRIAKVLTLFLGSIVILSSCTKEDDLIPQDDPLYVTIPDVNFEEQLIAKGIDSDGIVNQQLLIEDAAKVTSLDLTTSDDADDDKKIKDLAGIEAFKNLITLSVENNALASIAFNENTALETIDVSSNELTSIDLSSNTALIHLYAGGNELKEIDLKSNINLETLKLQLNLIQALDVSKNINLLELDLLFNELTTVIGLDATTKLITLNLSWNYLEELTVNIPSLEGMNVEQNLLKTLNVDGSTSLRSLIATLNSVQTLDVSTNVALKYLFVSGNQIETIDLNNNVNLEMLWISSNQLTGLDVSKLSELYELSIGRNSNLTCTKIAAEQMIATVKKEAHQELSVDGCQ